MGIEAVTTCPCNLKQEETTVEIVFLSNKAIVVSFSANVDLSLFIKIQSDILLVVLYVLDRHCYPFISAWSKTVRFGLRVAGSGIKPQDFCWFLWNMDY